jgi:hypothetical protein
MTTPGADQNELFFVRYEPGRILTATADMPADVELAHRRLCDYYWARGAFPLTRPECLGSLLRIGHRKVRGLVEGLQRAGWSVREGRLVHPDAAAPRSEAVRARRVAVGRARRGGQARASKARSAQAQPKLSSSSAALLSSSSAQACYNKDKVQVQVHNSTSTQRLSAERSVRSAQKALPVRRGERSFLEDVAALWPAGSGSARRELWNWGGWWRLRFREDPDKAQRVLAEVRSMVKERRVTTNPGAAAFDLWKRLP